MEITISEMHRATLIEVSGDVSTAPTPLNSVMLSTVRLMRAAITSFSISAELITSAAQAFANWSVPSSGSRKATATSALPLPPSVSVR